MFLAFWEPSRGLLGAYWAHLKPPWALLGGLLGRPK